MGAPIHFRTIWSQRTEGVVWNLAMPDDGSFVAVASGMSSGKRAEDLTGSLLVFDRQGRLLWNRPSITNVYSVATPTDGSMIVATVDDHVRAFARNGQLLWEYGPSSRIREVAISADGKTVAVVSKNRIDVLDGSGALRWSKETTRFVWGIALPRRGQIVAISSWEWYKEKKPRGATAMGILSVFGESGALRWEHNVEFAAICDYDVHIVPAISGDGATIALGSASMDGRLFVFRNDGRLLWKDGTWDDVLDVATSNDGSVIALGSSNFRLHVFDGRFGGIWTRDTGGDPVHLVAGDFALAVSMDGSLTAAGSGDENMYVFGRSGELLLKELVGVKLQAVKFSGDGSLLVAGSRTGNIKAIELT